MTKLDFEIRPTWLLYSVLGMLALWSIYIAYAVDIEYSDGYATVANAQYIVGGSDRYFGQRAPFLALWLAPAEQLSQWLELQPFDIRLHHLSMSVLHIAFLLVVVWVLRRRYEDAWVLLAFLSAIPNYLFFSYVPFISHDIFPGAIFLLMLYLASRLVEQYSYRVWMALVVLGLVASLVKHIYAIFWVAILFYYLLALPRRMGRRGLKIWLKLFVGALASGLVSWFVFSWVLYGSIPDVPFLLRPFYQVYGILIMHPNEAHDSIFPWWLYWRNMLYGNGILVTVLILPAMYFAYKSGSMFMQSVATGWLVFFLALSQLDFKEVRYLYILAPLSAILLIPVFQKLWSVPGWKFLRWGLMLILLLDLSNGLLAAAHSNLGFYRQRVVENFLQPIQEYPDARYIFINVLSFAYGDGYSPIKGDRNHRLFHVTPEVVSQLHHFSDDKLVRLSRFEDINQLRSGDILFFSNTPFVRRPEEYVPMTHTPEKFWQFRALVVDRERHVRGRHFLRFVYNREQETFTFISADSSTEGPLFLVLAERGVD